MYLKIFKPTADFLFAFVLIILSSPVQLVLFLLLFFSNKRKVLFYQTRPGKNEKLFRIYKFKTMNDNTDNFGNLLNDNDRLTKLGRFIRKTSLDELPQLYNVLKGQMSFVGPRPLLVEYLPLYNENQKMRHLIKPGITGWAQINGRNNISWEQKFEYDVWYVENISFFLDLKILFLTIQKITKSEGINQAQNITMEIFKGNYEK